MLTHDFKLSRYTVIVNHHDLYYLVLFRNKLYSKPQLTDRIFCPEQQNYEHTLKLLLHHSFKVIFMSYTWKRATQKINRHKEREGERSFRKFEFYIYKEYLQSVH